jgi:hypothetical protein
MTPGPGSNNASSVPSKKLKAAAVGNINHQDQLHEKLKKSRKQITTEEDDEVEAVPGQGSRETSRKGAASGLNNS